MAKFRANSELLKRELLNLGYTDCLTYRHSGLHILAVKDGLIKRCWMNTYFSSIENQSEFDKFVEQIDKKLN